MFKTMYIDQPTISASCARSGDVSAVSDMTLTSEGAAAGAEIGKRNPNVVVSYIVVGMRVIGNTEFFWRENRTWGLRGHLRRFYKARDDFSALVCFGEEILLGGEDARIQSHF